MAGIYHLNNMAKDAYRSYIWAYNSHSMKDIFNVHRLDLMVKLSYDSFFNCLNIHACQIEIEYMN